MRRLATLLAAVALWAVSGASGAADPAFKEYEVKAAYLYNFGKFIAWPAPAFEKPDSPLTT